MNTSEKLSEGEMDRFYQLVSRFLDGDLESDEIAELSKSLKSSEDLQSEYLLLSELHTVLEHEPSIRDILSNTPKNVISLPGTRNVHSAIQLDQHQSKDSKPSRRILEGVAAAILVIGFSVWALFPPQKVDSRPEEPLAESQVPPVSIEDPIVKEKQLSEPEKQYQLAVLSTDLGTGSNQRPPTNFTPEPAAVEGGISFNRQVRPILSENCFACHGPDSSSRKAKLRLDTEEGALAGKSSPIVKGKSAMSELIARIQSSDPDELMPPEDSHKSLTPQQKEILAQWIDEGAKWENHWAFIKPKNTVDKKELVDQNPVDYFVKKSLSTKGMKLSETTDRYTLIRRATLDLTGLPPTPTEVLSFVNDDSPDSYRKLLDDLFSRKSYGEHRARYWLDAARYGDTHGLHLDNYREIWPYRDWVIKAFNNNMPFDRFTIEQIGGDLLPNATQDQRIATGFNRCNVTTSEGGAIAEEFLVRYAVDRVSTTATVWLGLTAGCSQCHDHKFDPMTMDDFYRMFAYFNNTTQPGMDGNTKDSAPVMRVYASEGIGKKAASLSKQVGIEKKKLASLEKESTTDTSKLKISSFAPKFVNHGEAEKPTDLGSLANFSKNKPFTIAFSYKLPEGDDPAVLIRRTDLNNRNRGWRVIVKNQGIVVQLIESLPNKMLQRGITRRFKPGSSGYFAISYDGSGRSEGLKLYQNGAYLKSRFTNEWFDTLVNDFSSPSAHLFLGGKDPETGQVPSINNFASFERKLTDSEIKGIYEIGKMQVIEKKPADKRSNDEKKKLRTHLLSLSPGAYRNSLLRLSQLETELSKIESKSPYTLVMEEKPGVAKAHILERGEYDKPGDEVMAAVPAFLPEFGKDLPANRLGLGKWLVHPDNPLTARVMVNRIWQELFGTGLVKTAEDFGTQGENPSHQQLLDYLAVAFMDSGWNVKKLYRTIMTSETYQQSSTATPKRIGEDRDNRLLARGPRFRLDAEVIRDQVLFASGLLDGAVGGPSVKPYQPSGIWQTVGYSNSNTQTFFQDFGNSVEHRRTLYSFWKRTAPPPNMAIFDAPNRESCVVRRERTNTPLQALVLMNDPQFVRASRFLALRSLQEKKSVEERLNHLALLLRGRPLNEREETVVTNSLDQFRNAYGSDESGARSLLVDEVNPAFSIDAKKNKTSPDELAAWTMVASQIMNLDEVLNKN